MKKPGFVIATTFIATIGYNGFYYFHPGNTGWWNSPGFSWSNTLQFIFIDQTAIECITYLILFLLIRKFARLFNLEKIGLDPKSILKYEISFLPLLLVSFFIFNPFTQTVRFFYHYLPEPNWSIYFSEYFYNTNLYLTYLIIVLITGYAVINVNLLFNYFKHSHGFEHREKPTEKYLKVYTQLGEKIIPVSEIDFIQREKRNSYVKTSQSKYRINLSISELESILGPHEFVRINRSTMVRLSEIDYYSYWEYDKYILKLRSGEEFIISRERLKKLKEKFTVLEKPPT